MTKRAYKAKRADAGLLFLTAATYKRTPVFKLKAPSRIFFQELEFYRRKFAFKLHGYVLMPDHFHLILNFPEERNFSHFLRDFKSSVGKLIIAWAKSTGNKSLLGKFQLDGDPKRHKDARFRVFQPGSYIRRITSASIFKQKLDYLHANPLRARLVERSIDSPYSSLRNYELGKGAITIDPHELILP